MAALTARFVARAAEERRDLEGALARMAGDPVAGREALGRVAHRIAGSAGLFGFSEIGGAAASLDECSGDPSVSDEAVCEQTAGLIEMLDGLAPS